jgi:acetylornithine deacetylase/succinyl-diaminopimelate desuccinylase-like protein
MTWSVFERSIAMDTSPGPGNHRVPADDPRLAAFIDELARPELERLGAHTAIDGIGNLVARFGPRTGNELLFVAYPATHHANDMDEPLRARQVTLQGRDHWCGQGASEGKGPFVALLDALDTARRDGVEMAGRVMVAVSTEGSSSNASSNVMFDGLDPLPKSVVLVIGTENKVALGHRGRADIIVSTTGPVRHSSVAAGAANPIDQIAAAQQRVATFAPSWSGDGRSVTAYRLVCGPVAPHTMPERCDLALDCRFRSGDDIDQLLRDLVTHISDPAVDVRFGPVMVPAHTETDSVVVQAFLDAGRDLGLELPTFVPPWTFDAGAASSRGLPAILFGPSTNNLEAIEAVDAVDVEMLEEASRIFQRVISRW